jgi:hypothetical protein
MTLKCSGLGQKLGNAHNKEHGITPLSWLSTFGASLNTGVLKDKGRPLPLHCCEQPGDSHMAEYVDGRACPSLESFLELVVEGLALGTTTEVAEDLFGQSNVRDSGASSRVAVRIRLLGNAMSRPSLKVPLQKKNNRGRWHPVLPGAAGRH